MASFSCYDNDVSRVVFISLIVLALSSAAFFSLREAQAQGAQPLQGYAWSDTIGWIDLNCSNTGVCGSSVFGFIVESNGTISGHGWSDNIGWVSANASDLSGCPTPPCSATVTAGNFSGWLRALSGGTAQSGGWDGFVSLSGPGYGVTQDINDLAGYAWGDMVVGWLDFTLGQCVPIYSCVGNSAHNSCTGVDIPCGSLVCSAGVCFPAEEYDPPSGSIQVKPPLVRTNGTTQVVWSASDVSSCTVSENNPLINDAWTGASGNNPSSPITRASTYTLFCMGLDGSNLTKTASVRLPPAAREIWNVHL